LDYFIKWGWYPSILKIAKGDFLKIDKVVKSNIHKVHVFLAHKIDAQHLKKELRSTGNTTRL
jgi:hypothetical protein